ncbi:hypothetical protein V8B97DRAFT_2026456 [Scleroderma yunnanense]
MYYPQQSAAHSRSTLQASDRVSGQPKQLPPMSLPALLRDQPVPDYRPNPALASSYPSSSAHSHLIYPTSHDHRHLPQNLEHHSNWNRLPYALDPAVDPAPGRDHMHRFTPSHQHHHDSYHRADETRTAMSSLMPIDGPFSTATQLEHSLVIPPNTNYIPGQRPIAEPPSPSSYPSHISQSCTQSPSLHAQDQGQIQTQTPTEEEPPSTSRSKKSRRTKPHIELAPDQPLTTQGKPRARVYVACIQCRTRKIRCDGAKPSCHNCARRAKVDDECSYDAAPKRRGPDKVPGARQRMAREARMEGSADSGTSTRRRRRQRDESDTNENSAAISEDASGRDEDLPHVPSFTGDTSSSIDASSSVATHMHHEASTSTSTVLGPGFGSVIPGSAQDFAEEIPYTTNTQGLDDLQLYGATNFGGQPQLPPVPFIAPPSDRAGGHEYLVTTFVTPPQQIEEEDESENSDVITLASEPSLEFTRKTWWDSLLAIYTTDAFGHPISMSLGHTLTSAERHRAAVHITADLRFLFRATSYMFSFINVPSFLSTFMNPRKREQMQPSLVYAALAISTYLQSSDVGMGKRGRRKALRLRDVAQGALEASVCARWVDEELAQAAWLLAVLEVNPHPLHSATRTVSSMFMLDTIIRTLSLTFLDAGNPTVIRFKPKTVPTIPNALRQGSISSAINDLNSGGLATSTTQYGGFDGATRSYPIHGCSCVSLSLGHCWPAAHEHTPLWVSSPGWDDAWTPGEIRKETCRRLCWSSMILVAGFTSYMDAARRMMPDFFIGEPANLAILFPCEPVIPTPHAMAYSGKDTIWALNYRTILLWNSCLRMRADVDVSDAERARYGMNAWLEADALERALDSHTCGLERTFLYQGREYLFNVRLTVSSEFQQYIPTAYIDANGPFHRRKAEEWLKHQANIAQRVVHGMGAVTGQATHTILYRPAFLFWFMGQVNRALLLWERDHTLTLAVDVCIAFFKPIYFLAGMWPCRGSHGEVNTSLQGDGKTTAIGLSSGQQWGFDVD